MEYVVGTSERGGCSKEIKDENSSTTAGRGGVTLRRGGSSGGSMLHRLEGRDRVQWRAGGPAPLLQETKE